MTVGDIFLSVKAGPVTQQVLFSVVEDLGPYNAIVGRAWLHAMKAVPSTYHQIISYLTTSGHVDLQGSQLAACQCYQLLVQKREKDETPTARLPKFNPQNSNHRSLPGPLWKTGSSLK